MSSRTRSFIDTCVKFERGARQQARHNCLHPKKQCIDITLPWAVPHQLLVQASHCRIVKALYESRSIAGGVSRACAGLSSSQPQAGAGGSAARRRAGGGATQERCSLMAHRLGLAQV